MPGMIAELQCCSTSKIRARCHTHIPFGAQDRSALYPRDGKQFSIFCWAPTLLVFKSLRINTPFTGMAAAMPFIRHQGIGFNNKLKTTERTEHETTY